MTEPVNLDPPTDLTEPAAPLRVDPATESKLLTVDGEPVPRMLVEYDQARREQERLLALDRPANLEGDTLHFLRITPDANQACGGCGEPWPCAGHQQLLADNAHRTGSGLATPQTITRDQAAQLLNISRAELDDRLRDVE